MPSRFWKASGNALLPGSNFLSAGGGSTVWNSSSGSPASSADYTLSNANLTATRSVNTGNVSVFGSVGHSGTGDWSFDVTITTGTTANIVVGVANTSHSNATWVGADASSVGFLNQDGNIYSGGGGIATATTYTTANTITVRLKNNMLYFAKDGTWQAGGDPVAGTGGIDVSTMGTLYPAASTDGTRAFTINPTTW